MAERLHRTQILLEPKQHQALAEMARRQEFPRHPGNRTV
jgi:hypothetical protein